MKMPHVSDFAGGGAHRSIADAGTSARLRQGIWTIQGYGLVFLIFLSFFPRLFHLEEYLFFTLLTLAVLATWWERRSCWVRTPIDLPLWLFVGWVLATIPFAQDPAYSFSEWRKLVAQVLVFYWAVVVADRCRAIHSRARVIDAVVLGATIVGLFGLIDFFSRGGSFVDRDVRASAPFSDYNWLGTYLIISMPFIILHMWRADTIGRRVIRGASFLIASLALVATYSRAAWLGLVAQALAFGSLTKRAKFVGIVLSGTGLACLLLLWLAQAGYHRDTVDLWTLHTRLDVWGQGVRTMLEHPLIGLGYGYHTFEPVIGGHPKGNGPMGLHNTFLMIGVGTGIPGLCLFLWLLSQAGFACLARFKEASVVQAKWFSFAVAMMIVGFGIRNIFDYMFAGGAAYAFWLLVGLAIGERGHQPLRKEW